MRKSLLFFFVTLVLFATSGQSTIIDYGIKGTQYQIKEEDFNKMVQRKLKKLRIQKVKKELTENIYESMKSNVSISSCTKNSNDYVEKDYIIAPIDVILPSGEILAKKGERISVPANSYLPDAELCIVDGTNEDQMVDDINSLYKQNSKCNFILNNYSVLDFKKKFPQVKHVYILNDSIVKRFRIGCIPTRIELKNDTVGHYFIRRGKNE